MNNVTANRTCLLYTSIVSELQDEFDISITPAEIVPENFNSAAALWEMVCRLKG